MHTIFVANQIICLNNQALGMVKQWQDMQYGGRYSHSTYSESLPDFSKLAEAYGHVGMKISKSDELYPKLEKAFAMKEKLVFVDILVDPDEHVYPMAIKGGAMKDMVFKQNGAHIEEHIISVLMENEPGALSRVVGLFSQRNYNIDSLTVAPTEDTLSRLTLTTTGDDARIEQITKHLNKLVDVVKLVDLTEGAHIERELMLIKIKASGTQRSEVKRVADIFRGQVVDLTSSVFTVQLTGTEEKLDAFIAALGDIPVLEVARTGVSGISRGEKTLSL